MATTYDINQIQGSSLSLRFTTKDSEGNNINISSYQVRGYVKNKYSDTGVLLNLYPTIYSPTSGMVDVFISGDVTASLPVNRLVYDIEAYNTSGTVIKISRGYFFVEPEATI